MRISLPCSGHHAAGFTLSKDIQQFFRAHHPVAVPDNQFGVFLGMHKLESSLRLMLASTKARTRATTRGCPGIRDPRDQRDGPANTIALGAARGAHRTPMASRPRPGGGTAGGLRALKVLSPSRCWRTSPQPERRFLLCSCICDRLLLRSAAVQAIVQHA